MKLAIKFFCAAYITVLLSVGLTGTALISYMRYTWMSSRKEIVNAAVRYTSDSFITLSNSSLGKITDDSVLQITQQVKSALGISDKEISISLLREDQAEPSYLELTEGEGMSRFIQDDKNLRQSDDTGQPAKDLFLLESVYRMKIQGQTYFAVVSSDLSEINSYFLYLWGIYAVVIFAIALISGCILGLLSRQITQPLGQLSHAAARIADGRYGTLIRINSTDIEIVELSRLFNHMSIMVKKKIHETEDELKKRDLFVANFAHEMKTPMTAITGWSQMLASYELDEDEQRQAAEAIYKEGMRLEKMGMQLLDLYVLKNENVSLDTVPLREIGIRLKDTLHFLTEKYHQHLSISLPDCCVTASQELLLSLFYNLTDNAMKASKPEQTTTITAILKNTRIQILVSDEGRGIAPEHIPYLIEPFYREDKARARTLGGAGLGLAWCQEIARIHHTTLLFESEKGKGTTVSFTLKVRESRPDDKIILRKETKERQKECISDTLQKRKKQKKRTRTAADKQYGSDTEHDATGKT